MRVLTILGYAVSGIFLVSMSGCTSAQPSSTSSIPTLEIISIGPPSPAVLQVGQKVTVKVRYDMGECESVQIWVRSSSSSRGEISHPCSPMPRTNGRTGTMEGWFYFDDTAQVKEIKVAMKDVTKNAYVYEVTKTVDYRWQGKELLETAKEEGVTQIPGTFSWDIERDQIKGSSQTRDVWWEQLNSTERNLVARNQAKLSLITGIGYDQVDIEYLKKLPYNLGKISGSDNDSQLKPGTLVGIRTTEGNLAKIEILPSQSVRTLVVRWKLYLDATARKAQPVKTVKSDPVKQYGGLWYYADPWGQPDDRIVVLEGRIDGRNVLSFELVKHFCSSKPVCAETLVQKDQIEIRFDDVRYPDSDKPGTTMRYSLLYQEGTLLGQVFRDGLEPEKVVLRRPDSTMMNQIISGQGKENRDLRSRLEREQTQAASEKNTLKSNLESLEKTIGQLRSENSDLSDRNEKVQKTIRALEDMLRQANVTKPD